MLPVFRNHTLAGLCVVLCGLALGAVVTLGAWQRRSPPLPPTSPEYEAVVGRPMPRFACTTAAPDSIGSSLFAGQRYVVVVMATDCTPCHDILPSVAAAAAVVPLVVVVTGKPESVAEMAHNAGAGVPMCVVTKPDVWTILGVRRYPSAFLVGAHGRIERVVSSTNRVTELLVATQYHYGHISPHRER